MKPLALLVFTIATLWDLGEAVPFPAKPGKRIGNVGDPPFPVLTTKSLSPQATSYQFYQRDDWNADADVKKDQPAQNVINGMARDGLFTAVVMYSAHSSVAGPESGLTTPDEYIKANNPGTALITNGGFFITGSDNDLVADFNDGQKGKPLPPAQYKGFSVGPTSITKNTVDIPSVHKDYYERFTADDKTYLTSGPSLKKTVDTSRPPEDEANTNAGMLQYFVHDESGNRISTGPGEFLKSEFSHIPGGVVTANEENERAAIVIVNSGTKIAFAYTIFLQNYLKGMRIEDTQMALNLDGGGSIYIAWVANGKTEVLATGNLGANPTEEQLNWRPRQVTTMLKYTWLA